MKNLFLRRLLPVVAIFSCSVFSKLNAQIQTPKFVSMGPNTNGYYEYLPVGYDTGNQTYPLLIFIHGTGELGDGSPSQLPRLMNTGVAASINVGEMPQTFNVNGQTFSFIVISPQFISWPTPADIDGVLSYVTSHYRVNTSRVYLTGLSMGGGAVWEYAGANSTYANKITAIVPISGASWPDYGRARTIATANIAVWALHNSGDPTVPVSYTDNYVSQINEAPAPVPQAKKTIFQASGHDAWTYVYNSSYKENNMSIYQWMLQYQRGTTPPPSNNQLPSANAGADKTLYLPTTSVQLTGTGSDPDGTVASYFWKEMSGPAQYSFSSTSVASPVVSNLIAGNYTFRLVVTDNQGGTAYDDVNVNVIPVIPGKIEAEGYSAMSGVQTEGTIDAGNGQDVGWIDNGDWMDYNITVTASGTYTANFRIASGMNGSRFDVRKSDGTVLASINVPQTGGYQTWQTVSQSLNLQAGSQTLRIVSTTASNWNFNWMDFVSGGTPPPSQYTSIPGRVEAENWSSMSGVQTETTQDVGGGLNVGWIDNGDWMDYNITAPTAGSYNVAFRVASGASGGQLQLRRQDGTVLTTITVPSVGWQSWQTVNATVTLPAGNQTIRVASVAAPIWNINYMDFTATASNQPPVVNAGADQSITLPLNAVALSGSATDADGSITTYAWTKISGPAATIASPSTAATQITALVQGSYTFRLTATDNTGAASFDDVVINVAAQSTGGAAPGRIQAESFAAMSGIQTENTADAGGGLDVGWQDNGDWMDYSVNIPASGTYTLNFRVATVNSGVQFQLRKADASVLATITVPNTGWFQTYQTVSIQLALTQGQQTLRLFTSDAKGSGWNINWWEILASSSSSNQLPVVSAGADQSITLPLNTVALSGSATDADGSITTYAWTKVSGPAATIASPSTAATQITALVQGSYTFRLTATDNTGASSFDDVVINVAAQSGSPASFRVEAESFASMSGIQTENTADAGGGLDVGWIDLADWMDYAINVPSTSAYRISFRVASGVSGGELQLRKSDGTVLTTVAVPQSGGFQNWVSVSALIPLTQGLQTLRLYASKAPNWNINYMDFATVSAYTAIPSTIQAEDYAAMSGIQTELTQDNGGGLNVGWIDNGDWMDYNINAPAAASYPIALRVASGVSGSKFEIRNQSGVMLASIAVPNSGWQTWQTINASLSLPAGDQTLRIVCVSPQGFNINYFSLTTASSARIATDLTEDANPLQSPSLAVFPNPVDQQFQLQINNQLTGTLKIDIFSQTGALLKSFVLHKQNKGTEQFYLPASSLIKGQLIIKASMDNWSQSINLIKL